MQSFSKINSSSARQPNSHKYPDLIFRYSEACSSTLATTYSSGSSGERKVVTTDLHHTCTSSHTGKIQQITIKTINLVLYTRIMIQLYVSICMASGTSASAPLAAGIMALVLHANSELNWRDVQHITVQCAHNANLRATDWSHNAVGRNFSHSFGYGLMDASCMVSKITINILLRCQCKCSYNLV